MLIGVLLFLLFLASPAAAAQKDVSLEGIRFVPDTVTIAPGDSVKWTHNDRNTPHTVTAKNGSFDSHPDCNTFQDSFLGQCMTSSSPPYTYKFEEEGSIAYYCKIHAGSMTGTVRVIATSPPTSPSPSPSPNPSPSPEASPTSEESPTTPATPGEPLALTASSSPSPLESPLVEAQAEPKGSRTMAFVAVGLVMAGGAGAGLWYLSKRS